MQLADITATTAQVLTRTSTDPDLLPHRTHNRPSSCDMKSPAIATMCPPAPPKRGLQTKLSFKSFSSQNSVNFNGSHSSIGSNRTTNSDCTDGQISSTFSLNSHQNSNPGPLTPTKPKSKIYMADLHRTLANKHNASNDVKGCESDDSIDDLPPPPPELTSANHRIPPPTPPKRNLATH